MSQGWRILSITLLVAATFGCERSSPQPTAAKATSKATTDVKASPAVAEPKAKSADALQDKGADATTPTEKELPSAAKDGEKSPATPSAAAPELEAKAEKKSDAADAEADKAADASTTPEPKPEPPKPERVAIFTPGGPLLVDVTMTLDGRPYNEAFDKRIDELLAAADTDGDGGATWQELLDNSKYLNDAYAGRPEMSAREKRAAIEEYDLN